MSAAEILEECRQIGLVIKVIGDNLNIKPKRLITPALLASIKSEKSGLLDCLREPSNDCTMFLAKQVRRYPLKYYVKMPNGSMSGGIRLEDEGLDNAVKHLLVMYGKRLDLDDLLEEVRERYAIASESEPEDTALSVALRRAEELIENAR